MNSQTYRLVLQSNSDGCTPNASNSSFYFRRVPIRDMIDDEVYQKADYFDFRILEMRLDDVAGGTFDALDLTFKVVLSQIDSVYEIENASFKPLCTLCTFSNPYGKNDYTTPTVQYFNNNCSFCVRKQETLNIQIDYKSIVGDLEMPTQTADVYGHMGMIFQITPIFLNGDKK